MVSLGWLSVLALRSHHINMVIVSMLGGSDRQPFLVHTIPHNDAVAYEAANEISTLLCQLGLILIGLTDMV